MSHTRRRVLRLARSVAASAGQQRATGTLFSKAQSPASGPRPLDGEA